MKPHKQTSPAISSIAAKYVRMKNADLWALACEWGSPPYGPTKAGETFFRDIRKLAASALAQDQTKGQGK